MEIKRLKIGIVLDFRSIWMGGIIYIINVVKTFNFLEDGEKPEVYLFYRPDLSRFIKEFNYPYLNLIEWEFPGKLKGTISSIFKRKNLFVDKILANYQLNALYPLHDFPVRTETNVKLVAWWADLQEKHYPEFFSIKERVKRHIQVKLILRNSDYLVVSSQDVLNDFNKFYKLSKEMNVHIFHFVSVMEDMEHVEAEVIKTKYNLPQKYFLVSNQFHKHKNHKVLFEAIAKLKKKGIIIHLGVTGRLPSAKGSPYLEELLKIMNENELQNQISILGLISRSDQLELMRQSQAVLQPSLFEGWSTVIEDAKSLQVPIVASNLSVNIEQLGEDGIYFDPHDSDELMSILMNFPERNLNDVFYKDYSERMKDAARELLSILS